ncbi:MAG: RecX family transcriptional regulator [Paludibacteraceae bacterium]|nr:RecX family transcriptional regulator [Paludibacteraceae bacterium]
MDKEVLEKMANYCSRAEHCEQDIWDKLKGNEIANGEKCEIVEWLVRERFVDNSRYARAYVKDKFQFNKWGRKKIWMMLKGKRIDESVISEAMEVIDEDKYIEVLREVIDVQRKKVKGKSEYEVKGKLYNFALARGFEGRLISEVLNGFF